MPEQHTTTPDLLDDRSPPSHTAARPARRRAAGPDGMATLTGITSGALSAVPAAQYASIAWAGGRWLTGQAPTHPIVAKLDALQGELRQGPCLDALRDQHAVTVTDTSADRRWPIFAARAAELTIGSMLSLPLTVGGECLGVLTLYATLPRAFTSDDEHTGAVFADRAAMALRQATERDHLRAMVREEAIRHTDAMPVDGNDIGALVAFDGLRLGTDPALTAMSRVPADGQGTPAGRSPRWAGRLHWTKRIHLHRNRSSVPPVVLRTGQE